MGRANTFYKILEAHQEEASVNLMWRNIKARRTPENISQTLTAPNGLKQNHTNVSGIETLLPAQNVTQAYSHSDLRAFSWQRVGIFVAAALVIAGCLTFVYLIRPHSGDQLLLSDNRAMAENVSVKNKTRFDFSDGSVIVAAADTQFDVLVNQSDAIAFALRKGKMKFRVRPGGHRRWRVHCGNVSVSVIGTVFVVNKTPDDISVFVERGTVLVSGPGVPDGVQKLTASTHIRVPLGTSLPKAETVQRVLPYSRKTAREQKHRTVSLENHPPEAADTSLTDDNGISNSHQCSVSQRICDKRAASTGHPKMSRTAVPPLGVDDDANHQEVTRPVPDSPQPWKQFVDSGNFNGAYHALPAFTFSTLSTVEWSATDLFLLSDVARATGHPVDACNALREIIRRYPDGPEAGLAAYSLAGITADTLHQPERGAKQYEQALELILPSTLRETSLLKLIQMHEKDAPQKALHFSDIYITEYPHGKYRVQVTEIRSRIEP